MQAKSLEMKIEYLAFYLLWMINLKSLNSYLKLKIDLESLNKLKEFVKDKTNHFKIEAPNIYNYF